MYTEVYTIEFDFINSRKPCQVVTATERSLKALLRRLTSEYPIMEYSSTPEEEVYLFSTPRGLLAVAITPKEA